MLKRQYGIATPSSLAPVVHPEDAQPNEAINKRAQKLPPTIRITAPPPIQSSNTHYKVFRGRGGYRGGNMGQRDQWTQYAIRGNSSWRGRGKQGNRGGSSNWNPPTHGSSRQFHEIPPYPRERTGSNRIPSPPPSGNESRSDLHGSTQMDWPYASGQSREPESSSYASNSPTYSPTRLTFFSQTSATPPAPESPHQSPPTSNWMVLPRSPTPKLQSLPPLKRRKLVHPLKPPEVQEEERKRSISIEATSSSLMPPPTSVPKFPLPGRMPKKDSTTTVQPVTHIKKERLSPVKLAFTSPEPSVKQERLLPSPPPSIASERRLITESCHFYPFPESCKKSDPNHRENRRALFLEKNRELIGLGLKRTKAFSRDDGLVIEWTSSVPVWSDTLKPNLRDLATAIQLAHDINHDLSPKRKSTPKRAQSIGSNTPARQSVNANQPSSSQSNRPQTKNLTPQRPSGFFIDVDASPLHNQMSPPPTPIRGSQSVPRQRLPLPSRQNLQTQSKSQPRSAESNPNPVALPVAFSPRRSATPTPTSARAPLSKQPHSIVLPVAFSPPRSARGSVTPGSTSNSSMDVDGPLQSSLLPMIPKRLVFKPNPNSRRNHVPSTTTITQPSSQAGAAGPSGSNHRQGGIGIGTEKPLNPINAAHGNQEESEVHSSRPGGLLPLPHLAVQGQGKDSPAPPTVSHGPGHGSSLTPAPQIECSTVHHEHGSKITLVPNKSDAGGKSNADMDMDIDMGADGVEAEDTPTITTLLPQSPVHLPIEHHELAPEEEVDVDVDVDELEDDSATSTDGGEIEGLVADFLTRYCHLFDGDRSKLEMAYAKNALFSCRVHHLEEPSFSMAGLFAPEVKSSFRSSHSRASASTVDQGRTQIGNRLLALGPYQFCPRGVTRSLQYDVAMVDSGSVTGGILLTVHGEIVNPHMAGSHLDHVLTLDQSFLLRPRADVGGRKGLGDGRDGEDEDEDDGINGLGQRVEQDWPLLAVSHQMTVRASPLLTAEKLEEFLPWIENIL